MNKYIKYILNFFIFLNIIEYSGKIKNAAILIEQSVVPNQCSSLGKNNPLRLLDCSIFQLNKGLCCLLTITYTKNQSECDEDNDLCTYEEYSRTACIILPEKDSKIINQTSEHYKNLLGQKNVLIECSQKYIYKYFILINIFAFLLIF